MSRKSRTRSRATASVKAPTQTTDSYQNFTARLGLRTPNQSSDGSYAPNYTTRNRVLLEFAYRSSFLIGREVEY